MPKSYYLNLYYKQGADLSHHMTDEDTYGGLVSWANHLKCAADHIERLAAAVKDKDVHFDGDGVFIHIHGDETVLDLLVKDKLLDAEDDDYGDDEDDES